MRAHWLALGAAVGLMAATQAGCDSPPPTPPALGPTTSAANPPPAISGGTLVLSRDGQTAIAADPDRDRVYLVDLVHRTLRAAVQLSPGDEPGRLAEDAVGHVYVALRSGGALATIDLATGALLARRPACPSPRGVAFDPTGNVVYVACAGGELVTFAPSGDAPLRTVHLRDDLRDVVIDGDRLLVSTFRAPALLEVDASGTVTHTAPLAELTQIRQVTVNRATTQVVRSFEPTVAWRTIAVPGGGVATIHQRALSSPVGPVQSGGGGGVYGSGAPTCSECSCAVVHSTLSVVQGRETPAPGATVPTATLPVDVAVSRDGQTFAVVAAANSTIARLDQVLLVSRSAATAGGDTCAAPSASIAQPQGQAVAAVFDSADHVLVQTREPAALFFADTGATLALASERRADTGHTVFHSNSGAFIACASCHPEGRDDGHVWHFDAATPRRTQSLRGGLLATAPFHWDGAESDMHAIMQDVFVSRMQGPTLATDQVQALSHWLDAQPLVPHLAAADASAVERGRALFADARAACASCHAGSHLTNNQTMDVGTGGAFQVPSLRGLALRAPYMHDGCAASLRDRLVPGECGGTRHGDVSWMTPAQQDDLVSYLQSL
jgi:DNA-binding beta-propeller fold protein YncE